MLLHNLSDFGGIFHPFLDKVLLSKKDQINYKENRKKGVVVYDYSVAYFTKICVGIKKRACPKYRFCSNQYYYTIHGSKISLS